MMTQKCCSHCPGNLVSQRSNEFHECCQPNYVSGNLKVSSLKKRVPESFSRKGTKIPENRSTCYDQFALAKRLHAENLEHHPLPDKVHDSVFKNPRRPCRRSSSCDCCKETSKTELKNLNRRYGPVLGCKEPKTKMDLAICWETPVDPVYEPPRPSHIDGSEGGLAPAIFALVEHPTGNDTLRSVTSKNVDGSNRAKEPDKNEDQRRRKCCCECLCNGLNGLDISKKNESETQPRRTFRRCTACEPRNFKDDPRLIKSAVGLALGLEKNGNEKRNDDTLAPPFNVVNGSRDADYPEHWRLMSVYQQSYKNPYRRRSFYRC